MCIVIHSQSTLTSIHLWNSAKALVGDVDRRRPCHTRHIARSIQGVVCHARSCFCAAAISGIRSQRRSRRAWIHDSPRSSGANTFCEQDISYFCDTFSELRRYLVLASFIYRCGTRFGHSERYQLQLELFASGELIKRCSQRFTWLVL